MKMVTVCIRNEIKMRWSEPGGGGGGGVLQLEAVPDARGGKNAG